MTPPPEPTPEARRLVYGLLITLAAGLTLGRLASAERVNEPSVHRRDDDKATPRPAWPRARPEPWPTFSSNDRSRWATVRALVDEGTFVVGRRGPATAAEGRPVPLAQRDKGIIFEDGWGSVDKVLHPQRQEFYSTKPPLLTVIAAGEYWLLKRLFGWSIVEDRWLVIPLILVSLNVVPLGIYLWVLADLAERLGRTDWSRYFVVAAGGFATLVTPFLISFNNHTVATAAAAVTRQPTPRCVRWRPAAAPCGWRHGLAAGFAACNELPAAALAGGLGVYLLYRFPGRTLMYFLPGPVLLTGLMLGLNYWQFGDYEPVYAKFGTEWYHYEGSHWLPPGQTKPGIDYAGRNGESKADYAFHLLIGHHGWFSLTPIMLMAMPGMLIGLASGGGTPGFPGANGGRPPPARPEPLARLVALLTLLVSAVVIAFYIARTDNYGGWSNGPRWLMWLTPLWLLCLLPILDVLAPSRAGRGFALLLLALSILSMSYQFWNPWRHPWIYNWMESRGWINY
ncbi:MAG: hypothetical protein U0797_04460 [Gemmataceae bacterium]